MLSSALGAVAGVALTAAWQMAGSGKAEEKIAFVMQQLPVLATIGIAYLVTALAAGATTRIYLMRDVRHARRGLDHGPQSLGRRQH